MNLIKKTMLCALYTLLAVGCIKSKSVSYGCNPVFPSKVDAKPGEVVQLIGGDCFVLSALGSTFGPNSPVALDIAEFTPIALKGEFTDVKLGNYPKQGEHFAFSYQPTEGKLPKGLKGQTIQVVIRSEPITQQFKAILQKDLAAAKQKNDTEKLATLNDVLKNIDTKSLVRFYRRVPAVGKTTFTPLHDKIFVTPAEQNVAEIKLLPNGNLQIYERDGKNVAVSEEPFGQL